MSTISDTYLRYLANAWQCFETEPKVDYEKLALLCGSKTPASAREMLRVSKKKLLEHSTTQDGDNGENDSNGNGSPIKKTPGKKAPAKPKTPRRASTKKMPPRTATAPGFYDPTPPTSEDEAGKEAKKTPRKTPAKANTTSTAGKKRISADHDDDEDGLRSLGGRGTKRVKAEPEAHNDDHEDMFTIINNAEVQGPPGLDLGAFQDDGFGPLAQPQTSDAFYYNTQHDDEV